MWDVYIWPIDNPGVVKQVAKNVNYDTAVNLYEQYFETNMYDAYMVPTGTAIYV